MQNDEIHLPLNFSSRDTVGLEMIPMLHCHGFQASLLRYGACGDSVLDIVMRKKFQNDEMYLPWNTSSPDTIGLEMIPMLDCHGFQASLLRYGAWGDSVLDIVMRKKFQNDEMYLPWNTSSRDTVGLEMITILHCYGFQASLSRYGA